MSNSISASIKNSLPELIKLNNLQIKKEIAGRRNIRVLFIASILTVAGGLGFVASGASQRDSTDEGLKSQLLILAGLVLTIVGAISLVYWKKYSKPIPAPCLIDRVMDVQTSHKDKIKLLFILTSICEYIEKHKAEWERNVQSTKSALYIHSSETLLRTVQYNPDHSIFIHFNQKKKGDLFIGEGSFKKATLALDYFACKWWVSASMDSKYAEPEKIAYQLTKEHQFKHVIQIEYIVDYSSKKTSKSGVTETIKKVRLISPYYEKNNLLYALKNPNSPLTWPEKIKIARQLIEGVVGLHEKGFLHRDLKPTNIFLSENELCIGDLGALCKMNNDLEKVKHSTTLQYASAEYVLALKKLRLITDETAVAENIYENLVTEYWAYRKKYKSLEGELLLENSLPLIDRSKIQEVYAQQEKVYAQKEEAGEAYFELLIKEAEAKKAFAASVSEKLDIWSLGCILYEVFNECDLPWANFPEDAITNMITGLQEDWVAGVQDIPPQSEANTMVLLILKMLCLDREKRISSKELREQLSTLPIFNDLQK